MKTSFTGTLTSAEVDAIRRAYRGHITTEPTWQSGFRTRYNDFPVRVVQHRSRDPTLDRMVDQLPRTAPWFPPADPSLTDSDSKIHALRARITEINNDSESGLIQFTPDETRYIVDSGASISITNSIHDFTRPPRPLQDTRIQGIAEGLEAKGIGTILIKLHDGTEWQLRNVLYVPDCPC